MRLAVGPGVCCGDQSGVALRVVQRMVLTRDHVRIVPENGMRREVFDSFAMDPNLARATHAIDVHGTGVRMSFSRSAHEVSSTGERV
jgi:hypothetical protein